MSAGRPAAGVGGGDVEGAYDRVGRCCTYKCFRRRREGRRGRSRCAGPGGCTTGTRRSGDQGGLRSVTQPPRSRCAARSRARARRTRPPPGHLHRSNAPAARTTTGRPRRRSRASPPTPGELENPDLLAVRGSASLTDGSQHRVGGVRLLLGCRLRCHTSLDQGAPTVFGGAFRQDQGCDRGTRGWPVSEPANLGGRASGRHRRPVRLRGGPQPRGAVRPGGDQRDVHPLAAHGRPPQGDARARPRPQGRRHGSAPERHHTAGEGDVCSAALGRRGGKQAGGALADRRHVRRGGQLEGSYP